MKSPVCHLLLFVVLTNCFILKCFSFKNKISNSFQRFNHMSSSRTTTVYTDGTILQNGENVAMKDLSAMYSTSSSRLQRTEKAGFHSEINKIFPTDGYLVPNSDKRMRQSDVDKLIYHHLPEFNQASIATLMYRSAKEWKKTRVSVVSRHMTRITSYMSRLPANGWSAKDISYCMYGLQYMRSDDASVLKFLSVMSNIISESCDEEEEYEETTEDFELSIKNKSLLEGIKSYPFPFIPTALSSSFSSDAFTLVTDADAPTVSIRTSISPLPSDTINMKTFSPRELSMTLYALRGMRSDVKEVKGFLSALNRMIFLGHGGDSPFDVQGVSNALYGMQGMNCDCSDVRTLVTQITFKAAGCKELLDSQAIGNALYGLKNMNSEYPEIRLLLRVLAVKISQSSADMKPQEIANALYGLQGMSSNHIEVKELLSALEVKISASKKGQNFSAQEIGNALYGLQNMNSDSQEVRKLLVAISRKMNNFDVVLNAQAVGCALIGLQGMNSDHREVNKLLSLLIPHLKNSDVIDEKAVGSLFGLQRMSTGSEQVRDLLIIFSNKLDLCLGRLNIDEIAFALYGLQNIIGDESPCQEVSIFLSALIRQIKRSVYLSSNYDDVDVIENRASRTVESVISSIRSVKHMCGSNTQLGPQEIISLLVVAECS